MAYISKITPLGSSTTYDLSALKLRSFTTIGSSSTDHATALKNYFDNYKASTPRNELIHFYDGSQGNGSASFGYFLSGYDTSPYGGFFVAHYNNPYYVGIQNGSYVQQHLLTSTNYTSYTVTKTGTGASGTWGISITGNAAMSTKTGVASMWTYSENNNELNFGGTNNSSTIYMGYRAKDSKPIPTKFIFGGANGSSDLQAKTVYLGSGTTSYISSTNYTGNAATATALTTNAGSATQPVYFSGGKPIAATAYADASVNYANSAGSVAWANVSGKPINLIAYSGALNSGGWHTLNGNVSGSSIAISYNNNPATWNSQTYSASLVFGCNDTKGLLDLGYNSPIVTFGGASNGGSTNDNPKWYFKLSGTSGQTYTFPTASKTLAASDGSNASGTWAINISGSAKTADYPTGFSSRSTNATWGNQTGATITCWNESDGGSVDWRRNNPSSGKVSLKVDGRFYGNEGTYPAMLMKEANGYWGLATPDAADNTWIRTPTSGLIPYQSGGAGAGHGSLGTSSWYFGSAYIDNTYGNLKGNADTATALTTNAGSSTQPVYFSGGKPVAATAYSGLLTTLSWTCGTTAGPTLSITVGGTNKTATIPIATASASGVITTGAQSFAGDKTFTSVVTTVGKNVIRSNESAPGQGDILLGALGLKTGYPVYTDPTFLSGINSIGVYNNSGGGTVVHTRDTYANFGIASPGTNSNYVVQIKTTGIASPGVGGFVQNISSRANAQFIQIFRALVPVGRNVVTASNGMGTSYQDQWLTSQAGTGKWEWYARRVLCGQAGLFSSGGHVYLDGAAGTADAPVIWYLGACNLYDVTRMDYDGLRVRESDAVHDYNNGTLTAFGYSTAGMTSTSWLGSWDGYKLRAISPANAMKSAVGTTAIGSATKPVYWTGSGFAAITSYEGKAATATAISPAGTTAQFWRGDNSWSNTISGGTLKITNNSNTLEIGSNNTSWAHFTNSANIPFYFNHQINAVDGFKVYNTTTSLTNNNLTFSQGGGWSMSDSTWIRTVGGKSVYMNTGTFRNDGTTQLRTLQHINANIAIDGSWITGATGTANSGDDNATQGTQGTSILTIGNNIARPAAGIAGGANNSQGYLRLHSSGTGYGELTGYTTSANTHIHATNGFSVPENKIGFMFRPGNGSYYTHISYETSGNEALVAATQNAVTSFIFVNGESYANVASDRWTKLTGASGAGNAPGLQIKQNCVSIGELIPSGTNATYKLNVKGTQKINAGSLQIYPVGGNYNDGIRIHARSSDNTWAAITLCGADNTGDTGTSANTWYVGANSGNFYIGKNGTGGSGTYLKNVSNVWSWNGTADGSISGNANTATKANIATTANSVAYYSDTAGTFASDADFLWDATNNKLTAANLNGYVMAGQKSGTTLGTKATAEGNNTTASGTNSHAEGNNAIASGNYSHAEGNNTTASASSAHAEGTLTTASGSVSHAEGSNTTASGQQSHAEGANTTASGSYSHAEGYQAKAQQSYTHAEGYQTIASGAGAHAEGYSAEALAIYSHAEGYNTTVSTSAKYGHAEGYNTTVSGERGHAEGWYTKAQGFDSHAEGFYTIAKNCSQHVFGEYNIQDPSTAGTGDRGNYVEIVGNGTAEASRSNARTLSWDGTESLAGNLLPMITNSKTLGNSSYKWADAYITTTHGNLDGAATNAANTQSNYGAKSFIVEGDADTYYPTLITGATSHNAWTLLNITRGYSEQAPDTWNTSTHRGGLTMTILTNGDTSWGGNHAIGVTKLNTILDLSQSYCTMVGDIQCTNFGLVVWLRGGIAKYWITSNGGQSVTVTTYYESHTQSSNTVVPITTVNTTRIDSYRWNNLWIIQKANQLATARTIALTGAVTGNANFDGSANISITTTPSTDSDNRYVLKSGDTMTGRLINNLVTGGTWIVGTHEGAFWVNTATTATAGSHFQSWYSGKTQSGAWGIGALSGSEDIYFSYGSDANYSAGTNTTSQVHFSSTGQVWGAVWNDYAEMRNVPEAQNVNYEIKPGSCVYEVGNGTMALTTKRLQKGCKIISDTFGFNIGETNECKTPIAVSGRALVYLYEGRDAAKDNIGEFVCSGPNGTVSLMTTEEYFKCPQGLVGTISEVPDYDTWGNNNIKVDGRIWIYVK